MAKGSSGLAAPVWNARRSPVNTGAPWPVPKVAEARVLGIQRKLHKWAADDQDRRFHDLHNLVCDPGVLMMAWLRVRSNRGSRSAGVDGQTARYVEQVLGVEKFLDGLRQELRSGSFRPLPVKERLIPKRGGKFRRLGVPALRDRVVQAALKTVLEPIFEADFKPCSYGFRPGRRAHDAIAEIHMFHTNSYEWVLEADIEACFDSLSHSATLVRVRRRIQDKRVMTLIKAFLKAGILTELGGREETLAGTPQGGILSPLIANVALSALDEHFAHAWQARMATRPERERIRRRGDATYRLSRYADDFVICVAGRREHAEALIAEVEQVIGPLGLKLSQEKTRVVSIDEGYDFLGFAIKRVRGRHGRMVIHTYPSKRALQSVKAKVKQITKHTGPDQAPTSYCIASTACCGAGATTSATASPRGRSPIYATTPTGEWSDGCAANTENGTGAGCAAPTSRSGGPPTRGWSCLTRSRSAPAATATGAHSSRSRGQPAMSPCATTPQPWTTWKD